LVREGRTLLVGGTAAMSWFDSPCVRIRTATRRTGVPLASTALVGAVLLVVLAGCTVPGTSPWPGGRWRPGPEPYGSTIVRDVGIPMRDGTILRADIGYPTDPVTGRRATGTFPVLLSQDPYWGVFQPDPSFITRGYIYVVMDTRNSTARSAAPVTADQELFGPGVAQDGVDAVEFVAHHLDGSNGTVGLIGCSFLGITQLFTAPAVGPGSPVKAMVPACASFGYQMHFEGGVPGLLLTAYGLNPFSTGPAPVTGNFSRALANDNAAGKDQAYNGTFWQERDTTNLAGRIVANGIPALLWSGWQALEGQGAVDLYSALQNAWVGRDPRAAMEPGQPVTGRYQLVMGAGGHGMGLDPSFQLEWFDHWLKGDDNGIDRTTTPMHLHEAASDRWINVPRLPIAPSVSYQLGGDGQLATTPRAPSSTTIRWAPPSEAGSTLTYTSAPLGSTMSVAGPITASIRASSTTTDLELIASLLDVAPDGSTTLVSDGTLLGSMRALDRATTWREPNGRIVKPVHPFTQADPLVPGETVRLDIALHTTVRAISAGHSLRLVLTTQPKASECGLLNIVGAFGRSIPCNPTTPQQAALAGGVFTLDLGGSSGTTLNVPLVDPDRLPAPLACATPTSLFTVEPMDWSGGTNGPRDADADARACTGVWG
jgi:predicted acyl esterase